MWQLAVLLYSSAQRQRDRSGAAHHHRSQRCQLAALQPDHWRLPRNDGTIAARRPPPHCQQRCGQAALAAALPTPHSCAPSSAAQQAALCALLRYPQRRGRTGAASGQRQSQRRLRAAGAAHPQRWPKIERESGHKPCRRDASSGIMSGITDCRTAT